MNTKICLFAALVITFVSLSVAERVCLPPQISFGIESKALYVSDGKATLRSDNYTEAIDITRSASRIDVWVNHTLIETTIFDDREGVMYRVYQGKCSTYNGTKFNDTEFCFNLTKTESFTLLDVPVSKWIEKEEKFNETTEYIVTDKGFAIVSIVDYDSRSLDVLNFKNWENKVDESVFKKPKECTGEPIAMKPNMSFRKSVFARRH